MSFGLCLRNGGRNDESAQQTNGAGTAKIHISDRYFPGASPPATGRLMGPETARREMAGVDPPDTNRTIIPAQTCAGFFVVRKRIRGVYQLTSFLAAVVRLRGVEIVVYWKTNEPAAAISVQHYTRPCREKEALNETNPVEQRLAVRQTRPKLGTCGPAPHLSLIHI